MTRPLLESTQTKHGQDCLRPIDEVFMLGLGAAVTMEPVQASNHISICDMSKAISSTSIPTRTSKSNIILHMVEIRVLCSSVSKKGVPCQTPQTLRHNLQSFMAWIKASSRQEMARANQIDKNLKPDNLLTDKMKRIYLCGGGFKPLARFHWCAKCRHSLFDKPANNKSAMRHIKGLQL